MVSAGEKRMQFHSPADVLMITIAGGGVTGWIVAAEPVIATASVVAADPIGAATMVPKTCRDPGSETLATFALASLSGALAAGAVGAPDPSLLLYPVYYRLANGALAVLIHHRRSLPASRQRTSSPAQAPPGAGRLSGQGDGEILRPPVMTPGPQLPDQFRRWHGQHRAERVPHAVAGNGTMDRAAQTAPPPVTDHQQVIAPIGQLDQRRARRSPHHQWADRHAAGQAAERLVKSITQALACLLLPQPQQQGAGGSPVRDLPARGSPGQHRQQLRTGQAGFGHASPQGSQAPQRAAHPGDDLPTGRRHR
jgi:hypothetical protein